MRVALVTEEYPPFMYGGVGTHCSALAQSLAQKGIETTVFCGGQTSSIERLGKLTIVRLPCFGFPPRSIWFQLRNVDYLVKQLSRYSIIHAVSPLASLVTAEAKKKSGNPYVVTVHTIFRNETILFLRTNPKYWSLGEFAFHVLEYPLRESIFRRGIVGADQVIVCGVNALHEIRRIYKSALPRNTSYLPNGILLDRLTDTKRAECEDECRLVYLGRLTLSKGVLKLLCSMHLLSQRYPHLSLDIIGDGPLMRSARKLTGELHLQDRVRFWGFVPRSQHWKLLAQCSVVVLPSSVEVGPFMSALEAMSFGKPVVLLDLPFNREFVKDGVNGVLTKSHDLQDLSEKISDLLSNQRKRRRIGENALWTVREEHNWNRLVEAYIELYQKLL